jgi:hypothetical protein
MLANLDIFNGIQPGILNVHGSPNSMFGITYETSTFNSPEFFGTVKKRDEKAAKIVKRQMKQVEQNYITHKRLGDRVYQGLKPQIDANSLEELKKELEMESEQFKAQYKTLEDQYNSMLTRGTEPSGAVSDIAYFDDE